MVNSSTLPQDADSVGISVDVGHSQAGVTTPEALHLAQVLNDLDCGNFINRKLNRAADELRRLQTLVEVQQQTIEHLTNPAPYDLNTEMLWCLRECMRVIDMFAPTYSNRIFADRSRAAIRKATRIRIEQVAAGKSVDVAPIPTSSISKG